MTRQPGAHEAQIPKKQRSETRDPGKGMKKFKTALGPHPQTKQKVQVMNMMISLGSRAEQTQWFTTQRVINRMETAACAINAVNTRCQLVGTKH